MNKNFQSAEDFHGRLNMSIFTNLEKSYTKEDIATEFGADAMVLEKAIVSSFIQDVYKQTGGEIVKGKFNDTPEIADYLEKAKADLSELKMVKFDDGTGVREVYIMKAKPQEFQKGKDGETLEKGHVDSAFAYGNNIVFNKSGKDIKAKCETQIAVVQGKVNALETSLNAFLADKTGADLPTEKPYMYGRKELINCPYRRYHYCLTDYWDDRDMNKVYSTEVGTSIYPSGTAEEAKTYNDYNRMVSDWIEEKADMQFLELFSKNLDDSKKYELNAEQMLALGF